MIDSTRNYDLEELYTEMHKSKSVARREHFQKIIDKILREANFAAAERERLVYAVRNSDANAIRYYSEKIQRKVLERTNGRELA